MLRMQQAYLARTIKVTTWSQQHTH